MAGPKISTAVFDVDGMLLDTKEFIYQSYEHAFRANGLTLPDRQLIAALIGRSLIDCMSTLAPNYNSEKLIADYREFQFANHHLAVPYRGLVEMLDELKAAGLKLGVWSSRGPSLPESLKRAGIDKYFGVIVSSDQVKKHKPHPEGLLLALKSLGAKPENAAMLGDSVFDIEAGKRAKVSLTVAITHGFGTLTDLKKTGPDFIVDSLKEIPPILLGKMGGADEG